MVRNRMLGSALRTIANSSRWAITLTESEVTSKGVAYLKDEGVDVANLQVFFCPNGVAQATGTYSGAGPSIDFLAEGTLDLSGTQPKIDVTSLKTGRMPDWLPLAKAITAFSEDARKLNLKIRLTNIQFTGGQVDITGGP